MMHRSSSNHPLLLWRYGIVQSKVACKCKRNLSHTMAAWQHGGYMRSVFHFQCLAFCHQPDMWSCVDLCNSNWKMLK